MSSPVVPAHDLPALRASLKAADEGSGQVQQAIKMAGFAIGKRGFTTLIVTCGRMGSWLKAQEIFETMPLRRVRPNSYTYGAMISVCCNASKCDLAVKYFEDMKSVAREDENCKPDELVFKNLVPACVKHGRFDFVLRLYEEMVSTGILADKKTLSSILEACMRRRNWDMAARVLDDTHARDMLLAPRSYTKLISACADHGDLKQALEFFIIMQMVGMSANTYSCRGLMRAIESAKQADMGIDLVLEMRKHNIFVNNETYNSLLRVLAKCGRWNELISFVSEMGKSGLEISVESGAVITKLYSTQLGSCKHNRIASIVASGIKDSGLGIAIDFEAQSWSIGVGSPGRKSNSSGLTC